MRLMKLIYCPVYWLVVTKQLKKPTHISGSLLNHVSLHCESLKEFDVQNDAIDVYFSGHDAVQIKYVGLS